MQRGRPPSSFVFSHLVMQQGGICHIFLYFHIPNRGFPLRCDSYSSCSLLFPCHEFEHPHSETFAMLLFVFLYFIFFLLTTIPPPPLNRELEVHVMTIRQNSGEAKHSEEGLPLSFCRFLLNAVRRVHEPSSPRLFFFRRGEPSSSHLVVCFLDGKSALLVLSYFFNGEGFWRDGQASR